MLYKVKNLEEALALAHDMKVSGQANWFRGQTRTWPLLSSLVRKNREEQETAIKRLKLFLRWIMGVPILAEIAKNEDMVLAVAQHYGLPTNFVDFSTEPKVAAFFSTHRAPPPVDGEEDVSCIICLDTVELKSVYEAVRTVRPTMPEPKAIVVDIPELWRIQAQYGVFLEYPFDVGFERKTFEFDRIVFPTERNSVDLSRLIPLEEDIYPTQKSDLEVLLEQYFMLEQMTKGSEELNQEAKKSENWFVYKLPTVSDGIEAECFGNDGLPIHNSWSKPHTTEWIIPTSETWAPISMAPTFHIQYPGSATSIEKIDVLKHHIFDLLVADTTIRTGPAKWKVLGGPSDPSRIERAMELVWDGLRRWPYNWDEISQALANVLEYGVLVAQHPDAGHNQAVAKELASKCIGDVIEVEIGMEDNSYTRGYVNRQRLREAVRDDFSSFLSDRCRPYISDIGPILQVAFDPTRTFVFDRLKTIFSTEIVPTQIILRDQKRGNAHIHNLVRATRLGLP